MKGILFSTQFQLRSISLFKYFNMKNVCIWCEVRFKEKFMFIVLPSFVRILFVKMHRHHATAAFYNRLLSRHFHLYWSLKISQKKPCWTLHFSLSLLNLHNFLLFLFLKSVWMYYEFCKNDFWVFSAITKKPRKRQ